LATSFHKDRYNRIIRCRTENRPHSRGKHAQQKT
jgi:hypothetical protein